MGKKSGSTKKVLNLNNGSDVHSLEPQVPTRKGIYLLPNLLTTGALFGGFYAVLTGFSGQYEWAAMAIFAAMIFDGLFLRLSRLRNSEIDVA